jgi:hypothetical protein
MDKWFLHGDGRLEMEFRDGSGMKLMSSAVVAVDELNVVWTASGNGYVIGQPIFMDYWPGNVPADVVNVALYTAIKSGHQGQALWEEFQDELATCFAEQKFGR